MYAEVDKIHPPQGDPRLVAGSERPIGEGIGYLLQYSRACLVAQLVKNPPPMWETWVWSLEKGKATHSSFLAWIIPRTIKSMGLQRVGHDWVSITFISHKNIYICFTDYTKAFDCVNHNKLCKILKEIGIPDHFTCLLKNLYAGQEATVRIGHGTRDWFQIGKGVRQECIFSPCLFNLYAEYFMRNGGLDDAQLEYRLWEKYQ